MATIQIFRTYPAPGTSWRRWPVYLDGALVSRVGGASYRSISAEPGRHEIRVVHGDSESQTLAIDVRSGQPTLILVGLGVRDSEGFGVRRIGIRECTDSPDDLPRGGITIHAPGGSTQTFAQGRRKDVRGLAVLAAVILVCLVTGIDVLVKSLSPGGQSFRLIFGILGLGIGAWLAWKIRLGVKLTINQWSWPLEDWRVDYKGGEMNEWRRWSADVPDEAH
jgi:hypothetical protein